MPNLSKNALLLVLVASVAVAAGGALWWKKSKAGPGAIGASVLPGVNTEFKVGSCQSRIYDE